MSVARLIQEHEDLREQKAKDFEAYEKASKQWDETKKAIDNLPKLYYIQGFGYYDLPLGFHAISDSASYCRKWLMSNYPNLYFWDATQEQIAPKEKGGGGKSAGRLYSISANDEMWIPITNLWKSQQEKEII